jgi:hypothetical protein
MIVNSHRATGSTTVVVTSDLTMRRQNFNVVQKPPRQLGNQIFWCELSLQLTLNTLNGSINENNFAFIPGNFNGFSNAASFFDQYCVYSVCGTFANLMASGSTPLEIHTAIDFDSIGVIGISGIQAYTSYNKAILGANATDSLVRYVKPCVASQLTNSSNLPTPAGVARQWVDIAYPSTNHYGLRLIIGSYTAAVSGALGCTFTATFGFRNNQ